MNPALSRFSCKGLSRLLFPLALGLLLCGCQKNENTVIMPAAGFDSAPADLRAKWQAAAEFGATRNYLGAATNLMFILGKSAQLSAEQNDLLDQAWLQLGNKAFAAANAGDKMATEAVLTMRNSPFGSRTGRH